MRVKEGDLVHVLSGKDRGKQGKVIRSLPSQKRVIVENLNMVKRHQRPRQIRDANRMGGTQIAPGGVIEKPAPLDVSNVMLVCPLCNQPTRVGIGYREVKGDRIKVRVCKRANCREEIDRGDHR